MHHFDLEEVFEVAQHLMTRSGEGNRRSAASRAYYAVFLVARDLARISSRSADVHQRTQDHYADIGEQEIADGLRFLRTCRNDADYFTQRLFATSDAREVMKRSQLVRTALRRAAARSSTSGARSRPTP